MDEPSLGLLQIMVNEVAKIISRIHQSGVSIILVEQNARMAFRLADKAYVLEVGEVKLNGDAKKLSNDKNLAEAYLGGS